jgi:hypothetical protein
MNPQNSPTSPTSTAGNEQYGSSTESSGTLAETKAKITQTARDTATKVKSAATSTAARAKEEAQRIATEKKEFAAGKIGSYSTAIHDTARSLEEKDPNIAWFTHRAADRLQGIADYMRNRDFAAFKIDAENMARQHPAAFFGGLFVAGLVMGNLVKASRRKLDDERSSMGETDLNSRTDWAQRDLGAPELTEAERAAAGI